MSDEYDVVLVAPVTTAAEVLRVDWHLFSSKCNNHSIDGERLLSRVKVSIGRNTQESSFARNPIIKTLNVVRVRTL